MKRSLYIYDPLSTTYVVSTEKTAEDDFSLFAQKLKILSGREVIVISNLDGVPENAFLIYSADEYPREYSKNEKLKRMAPQTFVLRVSVKEAFTMLVHYKIPVSGYIQLPPFIQKYNSINKISIYGKLSLIKEIDPTLSPTDYEYEHGYAPAQFTGLEFPELLAKYLMIYEKEYLNKH